MQHYRLVSLPLLIVSFLLHSCATDVNIEETTGNLTGIVADKTTGEPVPVVNLTVSPGGRKTVTGSDGSFSFNELKGGSYSVDLQKEGYKLESYSIVIFEGKTTESHLLIERIPAVVTADCDILDFGENEGVSQLSFGIVNSGYVDLTWHAVCDCEWVSMVEPSGEQVLKYGKTATIVVTIDRDKLANGENETYLIIYSDNGRTQVKITAVGADRRLPKCNIQEAEEIGLSTAVLTAEITSEGSPVYTRCGFVYGTTTNPTLDDNVATPTNVENGRYSKEIDRLEPGVTYYARAFAENDLGEAYSSNEITFTTIGSWTEVATLEVSEIDLINMTAVFNGEIIETGSPKYTEKGFCYNTTGEPVYSDNKIVVSGNGSGVYSFTLADLKDNCTYYIRAYAIQCGKTYYGTTVSFTTDLNATELSTAAATDITTSSATLNGSIIVEGSPAYSERGFCYATTSSPTVQNIKIIVEGNGEGNYSTSITGLNYNTTYWYRTFAIQNGTVVYGPVVSFKTDFVETVIQTKSTTKNITYDSATLYYQCTNLGDPQCTQTGICYGTGSSPTISSGKVYGIVSTLQQNVTITGLRKGTTYYYRAFAIQDGKTLYGDILSFQTGSEPSVSTRSVSGLDNPYGMVNMWSVQLNGYVSDVGNPKITKKGFVYSANGDPESGGTSVTVSGSTTGEYSKSISELKSNTKYYVRAFVQNSIGKVYGDMVTFTTGN